MHYLESISVKLHSFRSDLFAHIFLNSINNIFLNRSLPCWSHRYFFSTKPPSFPKTFLLLRLSNQPAAWATQEYFGTITSSHPFSLHFKCRTLSASVFMFLGSYMYVLRAVCRLARQVPTIFVLPGLPVSGKWLRIICSMLYQQIDTEPAATVVGVIKNDWLFIFFMKMGIYKIIFYTLDGRLSPHTTFVHTWWYSKQYEYLKRYFCIGKKNRSHGVFVTGSLRRVLSTCCVFAKSTISCSMPGILLVWTLLCLLVYYFEDEVQYCDIILLYCLSFRFRAL